MRYDAIVPAGGRSRRLGGVPKAELRLGGRTLLECTVAAAAGARLIVVVGPAPERPLPSGVLRVREDPPFSAPAAAVAAGLDALAAAWQAAGTGRPAAGGGMPACGTAGGCGTAPGGDTTQRRDTAQRRDMAERGPAPWTLVLACDMPGAGRAVPALVAALESRPEGDGVLARDETGHLQPLAAIYRTAALAAAVRAAREAGTVAGASMFRLVRPLRLTPAAVPRGSTADVDTWEDARRLGVDRCAARAGSTGGAVSHEPAPRGPVPHGPVPHGPVPHGPAPDKTVPSGTMPHKTMPSGHGAGMADCEADHDD